MIWMQCGNYITAINFEYPFKTKPLTGLFYLSNRILKAPNSAYGECGVVLIGDAEILVSTNEKLDPHIGVIVLSGTPIVITGKTSN